MKEGENGSLRNAAMSAFEEGAPFMGAALAAHKQCPIAVPTAGKCAASMAAENC